MVDLNERIAPQAGWVVQRATDINNAGQIVGSGLHNGRPRAFRLTPIPIREGETMPTPTYP
jgi:hypothetical protein